jgi:hypothetical protein
MADGFLGGLLGGEASSAPGAASPDNPYGLSEQDRMRILSSSLGQLGATLLAAGQKQMPAQRAQYLAQLGNFGNNIQSQMYQAAQGRLMAAQYNEKMQEVREIDAIRSQMKENPGELAKIMGLDQAALTKLPATDIRAILRQKQITEATRLPEERELKRVELQAKQAELAREQRAAQAIQNRYTPQAAPVAGQPVGAPGVEPAAAPVGSMQQGGAGPYRLPGNVVDALQGGGMRSTDILKLEAQEALKQQTFVPVPTGQNAIRQQLGVSESQPLKVKVDSSGRVVDYELLGEDPNKPPSGFRVAGQGRIEPIPGGPATQIPAEVGARVGLAKAFEPYAQEIANAVEGGKFNTAVGRMQLATGTGEVGALSRRMELGKEALMRGLTGAGMNASEADAYAARFSIQTMDSPATIKDKLNMLTWSLSNIENIVTRGRGEVGGGLTPPPAFGQGAKREDAKPRVRRFNPETGMIE